MGQTLSEIYGEAITELFNINDAYICSDKLEAPHRTYGVCGNRFEGYKRNMVENMNPDFGYRAGLSVSICFKDDILEEIDHTMHGISIFDELFGEIVGFNCGTAKAYAKEICKYVDPSILCVPDVQAAVFMTVWILGVRKHMIAFRDYDFWKNTITGNYEIHAFYHTDMNLTKQCTEFNNMITAVADICLSYYFRYGYYMKPIDDFTVVTEYPDWISMQNRKTGAIRINLGIDSLEKSKENKYDHGANHQIYLNPAGLMIAVMDNEPLSVRGVHQYWNKMINPITFSELYLTRLSESPFADHVEAINLPKIFAIVPGLRMNPAYRGLTYNPYSCMFGEPNKEASV